MERMGYDSPRNQVLISAKKNEHYFILLYHKAKTSITAIDLKGTRNVSTLVSSDPESEKVCHDSQSATSSGDSDVSIGDIFENLLVNMILTSHLEENGEDTFESEELIQLDTDPWIKHLNTLCDTRFEQRKPSTEDKVTQINLGDEANPKPIFISESLSPSEKEDLIQLIREYIDVFA